MFHPTANRLAGFLEISALSIALAQSGGAQYKAGLLRIEAVGSKGTFGKRATTWKEKKKGMPVQKLREGNANGTPGSVRVRHSTAIHVKSHPRRPMDSILPMAVPDP